MASKNCVVLGGKGFIGSWMVNYLKAQDCFVSSVDVTSRSFLVTGEDRFQQLDLRDSQLVWVALQDADYVFNFAANMGGIGYITRVHGEVMRDNSLINLGVLEACRKHDVSRLFLASSACVYPTHLQSVPGVSGLREVDAYPALPDSAYGWEKLYAEQLASAYAEDYGLDIRVGRFHNVYGPFGTFKGGREKAPAALCRKISLVEDGGVVEVWGDGLQTRSFLYVSDAVHAVWLLMTTPCRVPLNIGSDVLISIRDLAMLIQELSGKSVKFQFDVSKPQGVRGRNADLTLITEVLGWQPKVSYREGLLATYKWIDSMVHCKGGLCE